MGIPCNSRELTPDYIFLSLEKANTQEGRTADALFAAAYCLAELVSNCPKHILAKASKDIQQYATLKNAYSILGHSLKHYAKWVEQLPPEQRNKQSLQFDRVAPLVFPKNWQDYKSKPLNTKISMLIDFGPRALLFPTQRAAECPPGVIA